MSLIICKQLKEARKYHGITQTHMAEILHVPAHKYAAWEQGNGEPPLYIIREFCSRFSISADYLLGLSEQMIIPSEAEYLQYDILSTLSEASRKEAFDFIQYLKVKDEAIEEDIS